MQTMKERPRIDRAGRSGPETPRGLDRHDAVATAFGLFAGFVAWATIADLGWPLLGSYRSGTAVLLVIGMVMCSTGARLTDPFPKGPFIAVACTLGAAAVAIGITGLATGSKSMFVALTAVIAALWVVTTLRHALGRT